MKNKMYAPFSNDQVEMLIIKQLKTDSEAHICTCESDQPTIVSVYGFECLNCGILQKFAYLEAKQ